MALHSALVEPKKIVSDEMAGHGRLPAAFKHATDSNLCYPSVTGIVSSL